MSIAHDCTPDFDIDPPFNLKALRSECLPNACLCCWHVPYHHSWGYR